MRKPATTDVSTEIAEEPRDSARRFETTLRRVLSVSKVELDKREAAYKKSREHQDRPGPRKRKRA